MEIVPYTEMKEKGKCGLVEENENCEAASDVLGQRMTWLSIVVDERKEKE